MGRCLSLVWMRGWRGVIECVCFFGLYLVLLGDLVCFGLDISEVL